MRYAVAGVDPGGTTGCFGALIYTHDHGPAWSLTSHVELESASEVRRWLEAFIHASPTHNLVVGVERFVITAKTPKLSSQPDALEIIGVVKELCALLRVECREQMKSEVLKLGSDKKLRALGWYSAGQGHANDAARQALMVLAKFDPGAFSALVRDVV